MPIIDQVALAMQEVLTFVAQRLARETQFVQRESKLDGASFKGANMARTLMEFASLRGVDLSGANLRGSELAAADLTDATVAGANFDGADLNSARIGKMKNAEAAKNLDKAKNFDRAVRE